MLTKPSPKMKPITPAEFRRMQRDLDMTNPEIAARLNVCRDTIQKWRAGRSRVPTAVGELMRFIVAEK